MFVYEVVHLQPDCPDTFGLYATEKLAQQKINSYEFRLECYNEDNDTGEECYLYLGEVLIDWSSNREDLEKIQQKTDRNKVFSIWKIPVYTGEDNDTTDT